METMVKNPVKVVVRMMGGKTKSFTLAKPGCSSRGAVWLQKNFPISSLISDTAAKLAANEGIVKTDGATIGEIYPIDNLPANIAPPAIEVKPEPVVVPVTEPEPVVIEQIPEPETAVLRLPDDEPVVEPEAEPVVEKAKKARPAKKPAKKPAKARKK